MTARTLDPSPLTERTRLFQALSDETRLAILDRLRGRERCVCELQDALGAAQLRLSFHLKVLRNAGLVRDRKVGRWSNYTLIAARVEAAAEMALSFARPARSGGRAPHAPALHRLTRRRGPPAVASSAPTTIAQREAAHGCCG